MGKGILLLLLLFTFNLTYSQNGNYSVKQNPIILSKEIESKILSGKLIEKINMLQNEAVNSLNENEVSYINVILYFSEYPSAQQIQVLENLNAKCYWDTWTPPLERHPYGFLIASVPFNNLIDILSLPLVKKVDTAERVNTALNNTATQNINAPLVWTEGFTGTGVKIGILDSGIDITYAGSDLPSSFQYKDYSDYPNIDNNVANTVTGHGTHVSATALGRGVLSEGHTHLNNGKGAFIGSAPGADLVFLKIGNDSNAIATDESIIGAIDAAVDIYDVDILSISYGGWNDYHDGSSALEQKVDWAYSQGVPFFCSAGNSAEDAKHYSGILASKSESDFIQIKVSSAGKNDTKLRFNLVWSDGTKRNDLTLRYYDLFREPLTNRSDVIVLPTTESLRGIESQYSYYDSFLPQGNGVYYLKVINNSSDEQVFHIYEDWSNLEEGTDHVYFVDADSSFTIGSPSSADHAFSVGAYTSKIGWTDYNDKSWWWGSSYIYNNITPFSSIGPTMDGRIKPDICAPGSAVVSLRDKDVYKTPNKNWIDNDGVIGGDANYFQMHGTSMACPIVAGAAALFLEKYPGILPGQIYESFKNCSNQSGLLNLPNNTWGYGKLDIYSAIKGVRDQIIVDGNLNDEKYSTLAEYTSGRNGFGDKDNLGAIKYYTDGENLFIGTTGEVSGDNNILLFMDFSGVQGRGSNYLGGGNTGDFVYCAFAYMGNVLMDFDVDFALGINGGNSSQFLFYCDAIQYGQQNKASNIGIVNRMGASSNYDIGSTFGGNGIMTFAYDSSYSSDHNKGVEFRIPISSFAGVDTSQTLRLFAVIAAQTGNVSNECIPGDPGAANLGDGADFSAIANQDFFTEPVKISSKIITGIDITKEIPKIFSLEQNYPNPFNPTTTIKYSIPSVGTRGALSVQLKVYDILGNEVATLVNEEKPAGNYVVEFDGSKLSSGIYSYQIKTGSFVQTRKMLLLK